MKPDLLTAAKAALEVMAKGMSANYWSDIHKGEVK